jgi:thiol-disulfide isomerase/thioredoxin
MSQRYQIVGEAFPVRLKWTIAAASALALAVLTLATPLPFGFDHIGAAGTAPGGACPADAKAANLNFTLKDLNNQDVRLASLKGKVILLDFWATWCGPCKIEIPWFIEFQKKYGSSGLQVVGVSVDDTLDKLKPFVSQMKMNYTVLQGLDHDDVQDAFGPIFGVPVTVVISRDGKICARHVGLSSKPDFESAIKALL